MADNLFDPSSLYSRLAQANLLPLWSRRSPGGNEGGNYAQWTNEMMAPLPTEGRSEKTALSHELTHATQYSFLYPALEAIAKKKKEWGSKITPEEEQFYIAGKKIMNTQPGAVSQFSKIDSDKNNERLNAAINALYKGTANFKPYRTSIDELQAHGIGNMTKGGMSGDEKAKIYGNNFSQHLDPTFATEFSVLMDLFDRLPTNVKQGIAEQRTKDVEASKKYYPNRDATKSFYNYSSMTEDPFAPTIK